MSDLVGNPPKTGFLTTRLICFQFECAYNASDFTVTATVDGFSVSSTNQISVDLTLSAERPVSIVELILPLDNYTQSFTVLENYSIDNLSTVRK